jgi:hypothetical protein
MRWLPLLMVPLLGCAPLRVVLDARPDVTAWPEPTRGAAERYGELADRLQATADFYDRQALKAHAKQRVMGVLSILGATVSGASVGVLSWPDFPAEGRPGVAAAGISMATFSGLFAVLPMAHHYPLKEAGYRRAGAEARRAYGELQARCASLVGDPAADAAAVHACADEAETAVRAAWAFPPDSGAFPPKADELRELIDEARTE